MSGRDSGGLTGIESGEWQLSPWLAEVRLILSGENQEGETGEGHRLLSVNQNRKGDLRKATLQ